MCNFHVLFLNGGKRAKLFCEQIENKTKRKSSPQNFFFIVCTSYQGIQESMLELQPKIEELVNMNEEMAAADGVDRQEFSMIQAELGQLSGRLSSLVQQNDEQKKRSDLYDKDILLKRCWKRCLC